MLVRLCVSLYIQLATEVEGLPVHDMYTAPYIPLCHHSFHVMTVGIVLSCNVHSLF